MIKIMYEFDGQPFEYIPSDKDLKDCTVSLYESLHTKDEYSDTFIDDEWLAYAYDNETMLKEILKDWCEDDARAQFNDMQEERKDPYKYRGINRNDFY